MKTWWRHHIETFSALLALCVGNSPVTDEFPSQRPVTRGFDVSLICALNKRLSKQSGGWWFETWSNITRYWTHCKRKKAKTLFRLWTCKIYPHTSALRASYGRFSEFSGEYIQRYIESDGIVYTVYGGSTCCSVLLFIYSVHSLECIHGMSTLALWPRCL